MNFQEAMYEVLEGPRYDFLTGRRVDIRERLMELIGRVFDWLFDNFGFNFPAGAGGDTVGLVVTIMTVVALILLGIAVFVPVRAYMRSRVAKRHTLEGIFEEIRNHTVAELLALSENAETRRVSVRYKYIAVILSLNERDIIKIEPSATNAIILRQIRTTAPEFAGDFAQIAEAFHLTWFGHKNLGDEGFEKLISAVRRIIHEC